MGARALRRPAAPRPAGGATAPVVRQRDLNADHPLRQALAVLQLKTQPSSVRELAARVGEQHPRPEKSWRWEHCRAYQQLFAAAAAIDRAANSPI